MPRERIELLSVKLQFSVLPLRYPGYYLNNVSVPCLRQGFKYSCRLRACCYSFSYPISRRGRSACIAIRTAQATRLLPKEGLSPPYARRHPNLWIFEEEALRRRGLAHAVFEEEAQGWGALRRVGGAQAREASIACCSYFIIFIGER